MTRANAGAHSRYVSSFGNWDSRASVRVKPRRVILPDQPSGLYFPPEFVAVAAHPLVQARPGVADRLLIHSLCQYLHFTAAVEQVVVLPVAVSMSAARIDVDLPAAMRRDAFKICTDEAWHAQFSSDFIEEISQASGVSSPALAEPAFIRAVSQLRDRLEPALHGLHAIFTAIVTETLISRLLSDIPTDRRLVSAVRELVADHAEDERRHHAYFRGVLQLVWPELAPTQQELMGTQVPALIGSFLDADLTAVRHMLTVEGFGERDREMIVADCYPVGAGTRDRAVAARATVKAFREVGAVDGGRIKEAFWAAGLMEAGRLPARTRPAG